jgi:ubiquitin carboxyl-terminal hydrolase L3
MATKSFVPLESNPEVFNELIHGMGVKDRVGFHDVYSLDEELLAFVPRPVYALILTFPISETYEKYRQQQDANIADDYYAEISGSDQETALWFKQTIRNACGTMAILHTLANGLPESDLTPGSPIDKLLKDTRRLNVKDRAVYLEHNQDLEHHHGAVAPKGETAAPEADESVEHHYVCLTRSRVGSRLVELDGRRKGPIDHGELDPDEDLLSSKAVELAKSFLKRESQNEGASFSIIALAQQ